MDTRLTLVRKLFECNTQRSKQGFSKHLQSSTCSGNAESTACNQLNWCWPQVLQCPQTCLLATTTTTTTSITKLHGHSLTVRTVNGWGDTKCDCSGASLERHCLESGPADEHVGLDVLRRGCHIAYTCVMVRGAIRHLPRSATCFWRQCNHDSCRLVLYGFMCLRVSFLYRENTENERTGGGTFLTIKFCKGCTANLKRLGLRLASQKSVFAAAKHPKRTNSWGANDSAGMFMLTSRVGLLNPFYVTCSTVITVTVTCC